MADRTRVRYLAPIALLALLVGVYLIVHHNVSPRVNTSVAKHGPAPRPHNRFSRQKFYVVQPGENLTTIAKKTGIPLSTLEQLNPRLDPNSLQAQQRLRLRR
jgi:LysM repeat protein